MAQRGNRRESLVKITVYVEGGGDNNALRTKCREGFSEFFHKAGLAGHMPRIVACGSRNDAYNRFCIALRSATADEFTILLVDSEAALAYGSDPWNHLKLRDRWDKPREASGEQAHVMVECMENWLLADPATLASYYGKKFNPKALPQNSQVEAISKRDVLESLKEATKNTQKGSYSKGGHSFDLLARLDPAKVPSRAPHAQRLIAVLQTQTNNPK